MFRSTFQPNCHSIQTFWFYTNHIMCKHLAFNGDHHNHGKSKGIYKSLLCAFYISLECWFFFRSYLLISWMFAREREEKEEKNSRVWNATEGLIFIRFLFCTASNTSYEYCVCTCVFVHKLSMIIEYECWSQTINSFARSIATTLDFYTIHLLDVF